MGVSPLSSSRAIPTGPDAVCQRTASPLCSHRQANQIPLPAAHRLSRAGEIGKERQARSQAPAERLSLSLERRRNIRQSCPARHLERGLALVDARSKIRIRTGIQKNLHGEGLTLSDLRDQGRA